jgi:hypothetical protein
MHQVHAPGVRMQPVAGHSKRVTVAVQTDQGERRVSVEQRDCVPTEAYRGIEHHGRPVRQSRPEQLEATV